MRRFRTFLYCSLYLVFAMAGGSRATAQSQPAATTYKLKIEATDQDRQLFLDKLNANGAENHVKFVQADQDFNYRIAFSTSHAPLSETQRQVNARGATAKVFDPQGTELFEVQRQARFTDAGAANAVAKELIPRLLKLKPAPQS